MDYYVAEFFDVAQFLILGSHFFGKGEEFSKTLPVNTSSWAGAYVSLLYCHGIVPVLY